MKTTISLILLSLAGCATPARVLNVNKRDIYQDGSLYGSHGLLPNDAINAHNLNTYQPLRKVILPAKQTYSLQVQQPQLTTYGFDGVAGFGSFLPKLEQSTFRIQPVHVLQPLTATFDAGYNYPIPLGPRFEEGPLPTSFDFLIPPAIRPVPIPNPKLGPGFRAPTRRILTATNEGFFYRYPGYIAEPGLTVRLPIAMARPTRIVVPQHGAIAFGSGGLGYSALPGGRIALGSGSLALTNIATARANPLPPRPPYPGKQNAFAIPATFSIQRSIDNFLPNEPTASASSNSLTVFPPADDQKNASGLS